MEALLGIFLIAMLVPLAISIATIVAQWKIFEKAGMEGWYSIIPMFNMYKYFEMVGINGAHIFWLLLPLVGWIVYLVFYFKFCLRLAVAFGKEMAFGFGIFFLGPIFFMILGFDKNTVYVGYKGNNQGQPQDPNAYQYPTNDTAMNQQFQGQQPIMGNPYVNHNQPQQQTQDPTVPHDNSMGNPY